MSDDGRSSGAATATPATIADERIGTTEAARRLNLSERQIRRLIA
jgi:hypothetical protein